MGLVLVAVTVQLQLGSVSDRTSSSVEAEQVKPLSSKAFTVIVHKPGAKADKSVRFCSVPIITPSASHS